MLVLHRYFSYLCIFKEKGRVAHGETACYYQRNGVLLKDRQGDDERRQSRSPGRRTRIFPWQPLRSSIATHRTGKISSIG